jgi:hypothetical protein
VIRKRKAAQDIEAQLAALEAQLRSEASEQELSVVEQESWEPAQEIGAD